MTAPALSVQLYPLCNTELWTLGLEEARRGDWAAEHVFAEGAAWGMAWVFAIQGMAEALKARFCQSCGEDPCAGIVGQCPLALFWEEPTHRVGGDSNG